MQTILGAGGTIGIELAKSLTNHTNNIRIVSRNPKKINETDSLFPADLTNREQTSNAVKGSEIVYLTAGLEYKTKVWQQKWPLIMKNVIDACMEHNSKLVFFDNVYMIATDQIKHIRESSTILPASNKGAVRAELDKMILDKIEKGKIQAIIARSADFYGAGARSVLMGPVYMNLKKGKKAQWLFNAKTKHSFTYTPDAGKATALLGNTKEAYNQVWNLPTDSNTLTGEEWVQLFAKEMGMSSKFQLLPSWSVKLLGVFVPFLNELYEIRYQYEADYFFDSSKFEKHFNFKPTMYQEGVKQIVRESAIRL